MLSIQNVNFINNSLIQKKNLEKKQPKLSFKGGLTLTSPQLESKIREALSEAGSGNNPVLKNVKTDFVGRVVKKVIELKQGVTAGITARSGAGKTTLIEDAAKATLGIDREIKIIPNNPFITIVKGDNWYKDVSRQVKQAGSFEAFLKTGYNFDIPEAIDSKGIVETMIKLAKGESVMGPEYIFGTCENIPERIPLNPAKLNVADSIISLHQKVNPPQNPIMDFGMYVDVSKDELLRRFMRRATSVRGNTPEEAKILFENAEREAAKHLNPGIGDLVINGELPRELIANKLSKIFKAITGKRD